MKVIVTATAAFSVCVILLSHSRCIAADKQSAGDLPPQVVEEYKRTQQDLQSQLAEEQQKLREAQTRKNSALAQAAEHARMDNSGEAAFEKYYKLLEVRYSDDRDNLQKGAELGARDLDAINQLFLYFLKTTPLQKPASVGQARETLEWGMDRLKDLAKTHSSPSESNDSELQIISKLTKDTEARIQRIKDEAQALGLSLNPGASNRSPASN